MDCTDRDRLWVQYQQAVNLMCECVEHLERPSQVAIESRIIAAKAAKDLCLRMREAWESHLRDHACD